MKTETSVSNPVQRGGVLSYELRRKDGTIERWETKNLVPTAGLDAMNDDFFNSGTSYANFYVTLFSNAYTPQADDLYTHIGTRFTEITTAYDEVTRPAWTSNGNSSSGLVSNSSSRATFTFNTDSTVINGAMIVTNNVKGDNSSGLLVAASAGAKTVDDGDELLVKYEFQSSSS